MFFKFSPRLLVITSHEIPSKIIYDQARESKIWNIGSQSHKANTREKALLIPINIMWSTNLFEFKRFQKIQRFQKTLPGSSLLLAQLFVFRYKAINDMWTNKGQLATTFHVAMKLAGECTHGPWERSMVICHMDLEKGQLACLFPTPMKLLTSLSHNYHVNQIIISNQAVGGKKNGGMLRPGCRQGFAWQGLQLWPASGNQCLVKGWFCQDCLANFSGKHSPADSAWPAFPGWHLSGLLLPGRLGFT